MTTGRERIVEFKKAGAEYRHIGDVRRVPDRDFPIKESGKQLFMASILATIILAILALKTGYESRHVCKHCRRCTPHPIIIPGTLICVHHSRDSGGISYILTSSSDGVTSLLFLLHPIIQPSYFSIRTSTPLIVAIIVFLLSSGNVI